MSQSLHLHTLPPLPPSAAEKSHHLPTSIGFRNPWPSFDTRDLSLLTVLKTRYAADRPAFVPVPVDRNELVQVRKPDFTAPKPGSDGRARMKITWIGHASFLVQCSPSAGSSERGINILLDPVFSERTSPVTFFGPKRYTPTPCTLEELCDAVPIDVICVSHNHYDHADTATLSYLFERAHRDGREIVCCVALRNERWVKPLIPAGRKVRVWEGDWWDRCEVISRGHGADVKKAHGSSSQSVSTSRSSNGTQSRQSTSTPSEGNEAASSVRITITPSQHASARSPFDRDHDLWSSFALELPPYTDLQSTANPPPNGVSGPKLYFSGDTAYRTTFPSSFDPPNYDVNILSVEERQKYPHCPAFAQIGEQIGPFDLALLPIGLTRPRSFMSNVHADSLDSISIHRDVKSKRSIGMHWGTVRGGISGQYEDVRLPPMEWEKAARDAGLNWRGNYSGGRSVGHRGTGDGSGEHQEKDQEEDWEIGLMDVGGSLVV